MAVSVGGGLKRVTTYCPNVCVGGEMREEVTQSLLRVLGAVGFCVRR